MYGVYLALSLALGVATLWIAGGVWGGWFMAIVMFLATAIATLVVLGRRFAKQVQPSMMQAQAQAQAGQFAMAIKTMRELLPMGNWVPMLKGQLYAQIGVLHLMLKEKDEAISWLTKASPRAGDAKLHLAAIHYRANEFNKVKEVLDPAIKFNGKHILLHNAYAWMLTKKKDTDSAIAVLNKLLTKVTNNEASKDNLLRLKNGNKMQMGPFGNEWYSLQLERPPASMDPRAGRPGFRQPPRKRR